MTLSIRLPAEDEILLARAAAALHVSKSEFIRRSIAAYASGVLTEKSAAEIDALYIGKGGGLREPDARADSGKRAILERLRAKRRHAR